MHFMKKISYLFFFLLNATLHAQSVDYARQILDSLCSPKLHGRGYVQNGERLAAEYLAREFNRIGLKPVTEDGYFQTYTISCNSQPGKLKLKAGKKTLVPGKDYLVHPDAPTCKGKKQLLYLSKAEFNDSIKLLNKLLDCDGKFIVLDEQEFDRKKGPDGKALEEFEAFMKFYEHLPAAGLVYLTDGKLTWFPAAEQAFRPCFIIKKQALPKKWKELDYEVESIFFEKYASQNVVGKIIGKTYPDSVVMVTAHYDHLGRMGADNYFPGASDNASGVAMMLNVAKYFARPENAPDCSMVFVAFGDEEIGLMGSRYYVDHPLLPLKNIRFFMNLDILGGIEGIQVVNGSQHRKQFDRLVAINAEESLVKEVKIRGEACISDHCFFYKAGVPSIYIYTLGDSEYHNIFDKPEKLNLDKFEGVLKVFERFLGEVVR